MRATLLRHDSSGFRGLFGPDRRDLHVLPRRRLPIGAGKDFGVHGINITIVVHQPVARLAPLFRTPFRIGETGGVELQVNGYYGLVDAFEVTLAFWID